jgi:hypothetical protein
MIAKFLSCFDISDWNTNPTIMLVETTDYPVEKILFPGTNAIKLFSRQNSTLTE